MSIGSLGAIGSLAASPAAQRNSDVDKTETAAADKTRADAAAEYAEQAAGIGETREESGASDRDADGRRIWEFTDKQPAAAEAGEEQAHGQAKDPSGTAGGQLDLLG